MADAELSQEHSKSVVQQDDIFRQLITEHHELDDKVRQLATLPHPTDREIYEEIALKKRKLALKDRIEAIARGRP